MPENLGTTARLADVARSAAREVLAFLAGDFTATALAESQEAMVELLERGVLIRVLFLRAGVMDQEIRDYIAWLTTAGALVRSIPKLPVRMVLVDEELAAVASITPRSTGEGLLVRSEVVLQALAALFESYWERAEPIATSAPILTPTVLHETPTPISRQEQDVLTLLAKGTKDEAVAEQLGISVRTLARIVTGLYEHTGADTRFELGVKASRFGWV